MGSEMCIRDSFIGTLDGKNIRMRKPADSGSLWHNYKGFFSSKVIMAICDARYCFTLIDVGEYGTSNDSGVWKNSQMGKIFQREEMNVPELDRRTNITTIDAARRIEAQNLRLKGASQQLSF